MLSGRSQAVTDAQNAAGATVVPMLRYRDPAAAIDWLVRAFGLERQLAFTSDSGEILYAQLTAGDGMVMLGPAAQGDFENRLKQPDELGGCVTQSSYLAVEDIDAHYERALAAGAEIVVALEGGAFGSRGYSARDPEGHIWSFGTYDPWRKRAPGTRSATGPQRRLRASTATLLAVLLMAGAAGLGIWSQRGPAPEGQRLLNLGLSSELAAAEERLAAAEARAHAAESALEASSRAIQEKESAVRAAEAAVASLQEEMRNQASSVQSELRVSEEANARIAAAEEALRLAREELAAKTAERSEHSNRLAAAESALNAALGERAKAEAYAADLEKRLAAETAARAAAEAEAKRLREADSAPDRPGTAEHSTNAAVVDLPAPSPVPVADAPPGAEGGAADRDAESISASRAKLRAKAPEPSKKRKETKAGAKPKAGKEPPKQAVRAPKPKPPAPSRPPLNVL